MKEEYNWEDKVKNKEENKMEKEKRKEIKDNEGDKKA